MRRKLTRAIACFAVVAAMAAALANCTQDTSVSDTTVSGVIGATGGKVTTATGQVSFPGGALTQDVMITVEDVGNAPDFAAGTQVGPAILCEPEGTSFADPVTITLNFDETEIPAGKTPSDIVIFTSPGTGTPNYTPLQTTFLLGTKTVQAQTAHFSYFVPAVPGMPILDSAVRDVVTVTGFDSNPPNDDTTPPPPPPPDTSPPVTDTGTVDSKVQDSGADTMTPQDSSVADSGTQPDTAVADSGTADTGTMMTMDSGTAPDTAVADSGTLDTGTVMESSTAAETSTPTDAGIE